MKHKCNYYQIKEHYTLINHEQLTSLCLFMKNNRSRLIWFVSDSRQISRLCLCTPRNVLHAFFGFVRWTFYYRRKCNTSSNVYWICVRKALNSMNSRNSSDRNWMSLSDIYSICITWGAHNFLKLFVILLVVLSIQRYIAVLNTHLQQRETWPKCLGDTEYYCVSCKSDRCF